MIIEIPNENSTIKWKNNDKDEWKYAEISDLIKAYERPQGDLISREALKKKFDEYIKANPNISGIFELGKVIIDNAPTVEPNLSEVYQEGHYDGHIEGYTKAINEERPQGEWVIIDDTVCECPRCKHQ